MRILSSLIICLLLILGTACQATGAPQEENPPDQLLFTPTPDTDIEGGPTLMSPTLEIPMDRGLQDFVDKAVSDLTKRLSVTVSQIKVLEVTPVVWPDSSMGCPEPGMAYTQIPEDGLLIRLEAGGQVYEYHSGGVVDPFLCEMVNKDPGKPTPIDLLGLTPPSPGTSSTPDNNIPPTNP